MHVHFWIDALPLSTILAENIKHGRQGSKHRVVLHLAMVEECFSPFCAFAAPGGQANFCKINCVARQRACIALLLYFLLFVFHNNGDILLYLIIIASQRS